MSDYVTRAVAQYRCARCGARERRVIPSDLGEAHDLRYASPIETVDHRVYLETSAATLQFEPYYLHECEDEEYPSRSSGVFSLMVLYKIYSDEVRA